MYFPLNSWRWISPIPAPANTPTCWKVSTKEWLYTDGQQRKTTYTNLDPGNYVFKVKAMTNEGSWSEEKELHIRILPPFWRTPLAIFLYVLATAGILFLARKIIVERTRMKYAVEQQRREADRMHAIDNMKTKFFTNVSHEFRTPLSLILSPLDKILKQSHDPAQRSQLQLIHRNAKRLAATDQPAAGF